MAQTVRFIKVYEFADYAVVEWDSNGHYKYVACWCPRVYSGFDDTWIKPTTASEGVERQAYWGQGHYFQNEEDALAYAKEEEREAVEYRIEDLKDYLSRLEV